MSTVKVKKITSPIDVQETPTNPKKRNWLIVAISVLFIVSSSFSFYQYFKVNELKQQLAETQTLLSEVQSEKDRYYNISKQDKNLYNAAKSNYTNLMLEIEALKKAYFVPIKEWEMYTNAVACVVNLHGDSAYHLPSCHHLGDSCYILSVGDAVRKGCWPCSDCHDKEHYYSGPQDTYDNILFKKYFGN